MDKSSLKKHKKASKRSNSYSSSDDDEKYEKKRCLKDKRSKNLTTCSESLFRQDRGERSDKKTKKNKKEVKFKKKKRKYSSNESSSLLTSEDEWKKRKLKKKARKKRKKAKREKDGKKISSGERKDDLKMAVEIEDSISGPMPQTPTSVEETQKRRPMIPLTKEEYEKQQSKVRRVFDPETGRNRLVKGDGEIIEEAVSYQRHKEINKLATFGDGASFQKSLGLQK